MPSRALPPLQARESSRSDDVNYGTANTLQLPSFGAVELRFNYEANSGRLLTLLAESLQDRAARGVATLAKCGCLGESSFHPAQISNLAPDAAQM